MALHTIDQRLLIDLAALLGTLPGVLDWAEAQLSTDLSPENVAGLRALWGARP